MRKVFVRILLVALVGVAVFSILRRVASGSAPVAFTSIGVNELEHSAFRIGVPVRLAVDAVGSFEEPGGRADTVLAAYGWIVRRSDARVVWRLRPGARPSHGTLASATDTLALAPGEYDAYFTSYGDPLVREPQRTNGGFRSRVKSILSRGGRAWHGEAGRWHFLADGATEADRAAITKLDEDWANGPSGDPLEVWSAERLGNETRRSAVLRVTAPSRVHLQTIGEAVNGSNGDGFAIIRSADADTVWTSTSADVPSTWPGGSVRNREINATVVLQPGLYNVEAWTDDRHAYDDWEANPPFAPWKWGVTMRKDSANAGVTLFDVNDPTLVPIVRFDCVGSDEDLQQILTFSEQTMVVVTATGEITDSGVYDGAELYSGTDPTTSNLIWALSDKNASYAGGNNKNKRSTGVQILAPGTYLLRYKTDSSFDCADEYGGGDGPTDGFWGVAMFAADPSFDPTSVVLSDGKLPDGDPADPDSVAGLVPGERFGGEVLVRMTELGNDEIKSEDFDLVAETPIHIVAVGELQASERLDYGWIENARRETVWEMRRGNTRPAGGVDRNRRFDGVIQLAAGTYTVHFVTDDTHAFNSFEGDPPDDPEAWGIVVRRQ